MTPQPCRRGAAGASAPTSTEVRTCSSTGAVPGVECGKPYLCQTAHSHSPHTHRSTGADEFVVAEWDNQSFHPRPIKRPIARGGGSWQAVSISIIVLAVISFASVPGLREGTRADISNTDVHTFTESAVILAAQDAWGACSRSSERDTGFDFLVPVSPCPLPYTCSVCTNTLFTCANRLCEIALAYVCCQL